jgi:hypothetical protein
MQFSAKLHLFRFAFVDSGIPYAASLCTLGCGLGFCYIAGSECWACECKRQCHGKNGTRVFMAFSPLRGTKARVHELALGNFCS